MNNNDDLISMMMMYQIEREEKIREIKKNNEELKRLMIELDNKNVLSMYDYDMKYLELGIEIPEEHKKIYEEYNIEELLKKREETRAAEAIGAEESDKSGDE